ncbi:MAG: peptidylprolyl isomerase [Flavobacteriales bacterium]|nr:MAG: peptidylprolyl isomerase [Flavobacteriales bacterium]
MRYCLILTALILFYACKNQTKTLKDDKIQVPDTVAAKSIEPKNIPVNKDTLKANDTITRKNAVEFLIAYGEQHPETLVKLKTRLGDMTLKLYKDTPLHRASFLFLSNEGYFNTTCFHRVVPGFLIQGGNSESLKTLEIKNKYQNYNIPPEFRNHRTHKYGAVAAAREWENNISKKSDAFEFYIIQNKNGAHHIDGEHTVFGQVIDGFEVLNKIAHVKTGRDEWPLEDVYMEIEVLK